MAVYQSTYDAVRPVGSAGMIANGETSNRISRTVEDATAIGFGKPVFRGTGDHGVTATPSAALMGITIANYAAPAVAATGVQADAYPQLSTAGILTQGVIWVQSSVAVADGDQAYVTSAGVITNVSTSNTILTGWFFQDTLSAAGLTRLAKR
ncbi:structural cement protein Gp24 [Neorhizobium sp. DAR64872/K0K18]|uniref:structural cement protein Gp24 n=1 Tax=Neorhizobium sp. DAR64872/K0K18 TaxID=3421958 RepID=UPI003D2748FD